MKNKLEQILAAAKVFRDNSNLLSSITHSCNTIFLNRDKMTQEEILQILLIAKEWNGKIETHFNKEGKGKKAIYTYYWRLYFGKEDPLFLIQLAHDIKSQKIGWDKLCNDAVSHWLSKDEPALGYFNKGMLKKAIEIGIPVIDLGEK